MVPSAEPRINQEEKLKRRQNNFAQKFMSSSTASRFEISRPFRKIAFQYCSFSPRVVMSLHPKYG
jgi:hypothetical protein